nr:MAG TPA: hypothetical protein [Caudoviricetes sp.]
MIYTQATKLAQYVNTSNQSNNSFIVYLYAKKTITTNNALIAMIKKSLSDIDNKPHNYSRCDTYE